MLTIHVTFKTEIAQYNKPLNNNQLPDLTALLSHLPVGLQGNTTRAADCAPATAQCGASIQGPGAKSASCH